MSTHFAHCFHFGVDPLHLIHSPHLLYRTQRVQHRDRKRTNATGGYDNMRLPYSQGYSSGIPHHCDRQHGAVLSQCGRIQTRTLDENGRRQQQRCHSSVRFVAVRLWRPNVPGASVCRFGDTDFTRQSKLVVVVPVGGITILLTETAQHKHSASTNMVIVIFRCCGHISWNICISHWTMQSHLCTHRTVT